MSCSLSRFYLTANYRQESVKLTELCTAAREGGAQLWISFFVLDEHATGTLSFPKHVVKAGDMVFGDQSDTSRPVYLFEDNQVWLLVLIMPFISRTKFDSRLMRSTREL